MLTLKACFKIDVASNGLTFHVGHVPIYKRTKADVRKPFKKLGRSWRKVQMG